jgi:hypothetical protein
MACQAVRRAKKHAIQTNFEPDLRANIAAFAQSMGGAGHFFVVFH